jgi:hypothetical protein
MTEEYNPHSDKSPDEIFWWWIEERESIRMKKEEGAMWPWTDDWFLQEYSFTNAWREDDKTTVWFRENVRERLRDDLLAVFKATIAFRWFNRISTGEILQEAGLFDAWDSGEAHRILAHKVPGGPYVTGAYMIRSPMGMSKLEGVCFMIDKCFEHPNFIELVEETEAFDPEQRSVEYTSKSLATIDGLGSFLAYEVATDLLFTTVLESAYDRNAWANPGPGAIRGLNRYHGRPFRGNIREFMAIKQMRKLLKESWDRGVEIHDHKMELRDIEHSLCEFDKYMRVLNDEGPLKALYRNPFERRRLTKGRTHR